MADYIVWYVLGACALVFFSAQGMGALAAVARQAPLARGPRAHGAPLRGPYPLLRVWRGAHFSKPTGHRQEIAASRRTAFMRLAAALSARSPKNAALTASVIEAISDLKFTSRYRIPFQFSRFVREHMKIGSFVESSSGRHHHRRRRQPLLRFDGLVRCERVRLRLLQGVHRARQRACARSRSRARQLPPGPRVQRAPLARDLRYGRNLVSHVGDRGRDAGGAARPLPHGPQPSGALLRRLSRLVGRCAAGRRQPAHRARDLHARGHGRGGAAGPAHPPRHRLRAGQSAAGAASERECAGRLRPDRQRPQRSLRPRRVPCMAREIARGLQRARHRADFRRSVRRLPARARRRPGVLRRARRHGHLRQDGGGRAAGRRSLRTGANSCGASARTGPRISASRAARSTRIPM